MKKQKSELLFWHFGAIARAAAATVSDPLRIERTTDDCIAKSDVLHAPAAHQDNRVLLEVVLLAGDVRGDLLTA